MGSRSPVTARKSSKNNPLARLRALPEAIIAALSHASSSARLLFGIAAGTFAWLLFNRLSAHPFDDWRTGFPLLILFYTVYFGLVEGVVKVVQREQVQREQARSEQLFEITKGLKANADDTLEIAKTIRRLGMKILDHLEEQNDR